MRSTLPGWRFPVGQRYFCLACPTNTGSRQPQCRVFVMIIGSLHMTFHLPESHSLKEKRMVVKSLLARARNDFAVAAAEVGDTERWQIAELGFACVSESQQHVAEVLQHVQDFVERTRPDLTILEAAVDFFDQ